MVKHPLMVQWVVGSILHVGPIELFVSFQPVLHNWYNKCHGILSVVSGYNFLVVNRKE